MTQLSLLSLPVPVTATTTTIYAHQVRVPVDTSERSDTAGLLFKAIRRLHDETNRDGAFHDFIIVTLAVLNRFSEGEAPYMESIKGMSRKAVDLCVEGFNILVNHFWVEGCFYDILGDVYMQVRSDWAGKRLGQYFTPWPVCKMMSAMTMGEPDWIRLENGPQVNINDPACGSGAMLLAAKAHMMDQVIGEDNPRRFLRYVRLYGQDLDRVCAGMARIQVAMSDERFMTNFMLASMTENRAA